jgi:hypothetical protein
VGVWHHQATASWAKDESADDTSVQVGDFGNLPGRELRIGWGYDEVVTLFSTTAFIDTNRTYTLSGSWEIDNVLDVPRGFIAGLAEFSAADGALVRRLTPDTLVFGNTNAPVIGETGAFNVVLGPAGLSAAGASPSNHIGVFLHHDDGGVLYDDTFPLKNDVYLVDDVRLAVDVDSVFEQWAINHGVSGAANDADFDGLPNLAEFGLGGNPTDAGSTGHRPMLQSASNVFHYVYPRRRNSGLLYSVERSTTLAGGIWTTNDCVELPGAGPIDADFEAVTNLIPADWNEAFIRLRMEER